MWSDLNMHDRHKLIRLAVTNGVYDLDTIRSLYDDTQNTYDKGGPIGRKLIRDINERSDADFVKRLQDRNREYIVNPDNTISTHKLSWATDNQGNAIVYPEVQNTPAGLVDYSYDRNRAFEEALRNRDTLMMSPSQAEWFTTNYKKYYPSFRYDRGGNIKIAPYKDNASYPDRKLYRNVKRDFRKNPEAEYKDYEDYGVRVYNPSLSSDAPNRKERQEVMLERIRQDFPEIQKNDVNNTVFKTGNTGWGNSNVNGDNRTLFGMQQNYDFVNNIVPYAKLGMETPESIQRRKELERKNRNTTYEYTTNFDLGGDLQTKPNRTLPPVDKTIEMLRMKALEKALMEQSQNIPNVMPVNDAVAYNYAKPYVAPQPETVNLANVLDKKNYIDIKRTVPVAEARPTFINTYKDGGNTGNPPQDWIKTWQQESNKQAVSKPIGTYNVVATDGNSMVTIPRNVNNINTELTLNSNNYTPDMSWYKDPLTNTKMVTEMPIEPLYGFKDPVFMAALGTGALAKGALTPVTHIIKEGIKPTLTVMSKPLTSITKIFGNTVNPFLATEMIKGASLGDLIINNALTLNGINNAFSNNGLEKTYNHIKKGEYYSGIKSGLGDLLDLSGMIGIANSLNKMNKVINKNKLGRNILDDLSNELFYLKEPEKLNIYLQEAENNARNKVLKINNYRNYRLMAIPAPLNLNKINKYTNISFSRRFKDYGYKNVLTSQGYNDVGDIKINPMNIGYMIGKNKQSPLPLEGLLGHELDHSYQPYLYTSPTIPDNTIHYWSANPQSPDYNIWKVLDKNKKTHSWASSPDEVLSEMTNWKILKNEYQVPYKEIQNKQYYINNTSRRFHISKEQAKDLLQKASEKGYF